MEPGSDIPPDLSWPDGDQGGFVVSSAPDQYHVSGDGISVSYYPDGFGPVFEDRGRLILEYQDANRSQAFYSDQVRTVKVDDLGMVVSMTIAEGVDTGDTTFSLLIPDVELPDQQTSAVIHTEGIITVHRVFVALIGHPQSETYTVTGLDGTAAVGPLPD
jgi:hypothetical protein